MDSNITASPKLMLSMETRITGPEKTSFPFCDILFAMKYSKFNIFDVLKRRNY